MRAYFDYAATAPIRPSVKKGVLPFLEIIYGNPSSTYREGQDARFAIEMARQQVAQSVGASSSEITFTSGGTFSNHWALSASLEKRFSEGKTHIITSAIEHPSVLKTLEWLGNLGASITILPVNQEGTIDLQDLQSAITPYTALCSIMWVNNELGTISPIQEIGDICHNNNILFHVDAVQALGSFPINLSDLPVDLMSFSAHKIGGIKGCGALYIRDGLNIPSALHGGAQERGKCAGTENIVGIVGFGIATEENAQQLPNCKEKIFTFKKEILSSFHKIPNLTLNVSENTIDSILNFRIEGVSNEDLLTCCDMEGLSLSAGSACSSGSIEPSPVLLAIGLSKEAANSSFRLSMGYGTTEKDIAFLLDKFPKIISKMRNQ